MKNCALLLLLLLTIAPISIAQQQPAGTFTVAPLWHEGDSATFTFGDITGVNRNYEVTLGVWCTFPDGSQLRWGNIEPPHNPYIYEFNSFGKIFSNYTVELYLPVYGTGYECTARLIAIHWFKGQPVEGWTLDEHNFSVIP